MCGIFAYLGPENPLDICLQGLKGVESRGYDSAGLAVVFNKEIFSFKKKGSVEGLFHALAANELSSPPFDQLDAIIGHTRWATHGEPDDTNAHPHLDETKAFALVHNGIIENSHALKQELSALGKQFLSDTDTEVIVQMMHHQYEGDLLEAFSKTLESLEGSFAIVAIHRDYPDMMLAAARESPLAIGYNQSKKEQFISSDPNTFIGRDLDVVFLEKDQIALIRKGHLQIYDSRLKALSLKSRKFSAKSLSPPSKEGYAHYMLKEIYEQPKMIENLLEKRFPKNTPIFPELTPFKGLVDVDQIILAGCGTSWHAGKFAADLFEEIAGVSSRAEIASELRYKRPVLSKKTLFIAISQSGETADTIAALREAKKRGIKTLTLCNVNYSTLVRESDYTILLDAGIEISVCSTKAFTSEIATLLLLAVYIAQKKKRLFLGQTALVSSVQQIPKALSKVLEKADEIYQIADAYSSYDRLFYLGRRHMYTACLEAALKVKEISYIDANGYPAGELKHGPIALLDENSPVIAFCANQETLAKTTSNLLEIKARKAPILAIASSSQTGIASIADDTIYLPSMNDILDVFPATIAGQLFAYGTAKALRRLIDKPRNLAKCVTVD